MIEKSEKESGKIWKNMQATHIDVLAGKRSGGTWKCADSKHSNIKTAIDTIARNVQSINAYDFSIAFERLDRSRHRNRSNRRRKIISAKRSKINAAPAENWSGPENRDASISLCNHIANAKEFSSVFEHLDRSNGLHRSNRRQKNRFEMFRKINANPKKIVRAPKTKMRRFHCANTV